MLLPSRLLADTAQLAPDNQVLFLNSAADPFVSLVARQLTTGTITLAEDNIASLHVGLQDFHEYTLREPAATMDVAIMNLLYQPGNAWTLYGLQLAAYALKPGGRLYVVGAKDRGVLSIAKRMQQYFGNVETLSISKGYRVVCSYNSFLDSTSRRGRASQAPLLALPVVSVPQTASQTGWLWSRLHRHTYGTPGEQRHHGRCQPGHSGCGQTPS